MSGGQGIRTLAPVSRPNPLAGDPLHHLGNPPEANYFPDTFLYRGKICGGEDGIRTHVSLRTNGFQDRLVMTTSIPLQTVRRPAAPVRR